GTLRLVRVALRHARRRTSRDRPGSMAGTTRTAALRDTPALVPLLPPFVLFATKAILFIPEPVPLLSTAPAPFAGAGVLRTKAVPRASGSVLSGTKPRLLLAEPV